MLGRHLNRHRINTRVSTRRARTLLARAEQQGYAQQLEDHPAVSAVRWGREENHQPRYKALPHLTTITTRAPSPAER